MSFVRPGSTRFHLLEEIFPEVVDEAGIVEGGECVECENREVRHFPFM